MEILRLDLVLFIQIITGIIIFTVGAIWYYRKNRGGYFAVFLKKVSETYSKIATVQFKPETPSVVHGEKTFTINLENPAFRDDSGKFGGKVVVYFDYESGSQLSFREYKSQINPDDLDLLVSRKIIAQLVSRLNTMQGMSIILLILGIGMGIAVGFIIGHVAFPNNVPIPSNSTIINTPFPTNIPPPTMGP